MVLFIPKVLSDFIFLNYNLQSCLFICCCSVIHSLTFLLCHFPQSSIPVRFQIAACLDRSNVSYIDLMRCSVLFYVLYKQRIQSLSQSVMLSTRLTSVIQMRTPRFRLFCLTTASKYSVINSFEYQQMNIQKSYLKIIS